MKSVDQLGYRLEVDRRILVVSVTQSAVLSPTVLALAVSVLHEPIGQDVVIILAMAVQEEQKVSKSELSRTRILAKTFRWKFATQLTHQARRRQ